MTCASRASRGLTHSRAPDAKFANGSFLAG